MTAELTHPSSILVAGHRGLVGSAIVRKLRSAGYSNLLTPGRGELDLSRQDSVEKYFSKQRPAFVFLAAAKVGGIWANNTYPGDFIRENLLIQTLAIDAAYKNGCQKLLYLGSSCIYPKLAAQPLKEEALLTGPLEPTNDAYAVAKIAGWKMCEAYRRQFGFNAIGLMPTNLYGPGDNFDLQNSHVLPALVRRFHEAKLTNAKSVTVWGSGTPKREFLHCDDLASAAVYLMERYNGAELLNVGVGVDVTIAELVDLVRKTTGYAGEVNWDHSKPDGTPRKILDVSHLSAQGWKAAIALPDGLASTYSWFQRHYDEIKATGKAASA